MNCTTEPPSPAIKAFIAAITAKYPNIVDLPDDKVDDGVWSDGPLLNNASGPLFYFGVVGSSSPSWHEWRPSTGSCASTAKTGSACPVK